jgi:hypothetical protein
MPNLNPAVEPVLTLAVSAFTEVVSVVEVDDDEDPLQPIIILKTKRDKKMEANRFICHFLMKK